MQKMLDRQTPVRIDLKPVRSLAATSRLVGIEKTTRRSAVWIGTLVRAGRRWIWRHEVRPDGSWHDEALGHETRRITRVSLGSHYLAVLEQAADEQPVIGF